MSEAPLPLLNSPTPPPRRWSAGAEEAEESIPLQLPSVTHSHDSGTHDTFLRRRRTRNGAQSQTLNKLEVTPTYPTQEGRADWTRSSVRWYTLLYWRRRREMRMESVSPFRDCPALSLSLSMSLRSLSVCVWVCNDPANPSAKVARIDCLGPRRKSTAQLCTTENRSRRVREREKEKDRAKATKGERRETFSPSLFLKYTPVYVRSNALCISLGLLLHCNMTILFVCRSSIH